MSQREHAVQLAELLDENEVLQLQIDELKSRLSQYEEVEESSTQSEANVSEWAEWPYCWFVNGWNQTAQRFHSLHATLQEKSLAQRNLRGQRRFQQQNCLDDAELHLL